MNIEANGRSSVELGRRYLPFIVCLLMANKRVREVQARIQKTGLKLVAKVLDFLRFKLPQISHISRIHKNNRIYS